MSRKNSNEVFVITLLAILAAVLGGAVFVAAQKTEPKATRKASEKIPTTIASEATKEGFDKIKDGMSKSAVVALLGNKYEVALEARGGGKSREGLVWKRPDGFALCTVELENNKVVSRLWLNLPAFK